MTDAPELTHRQRLQLMLDSVPLPPMPKGFEDWSYYDVPVGTLLRQDMWVEFLGILGKGNYKLLAMTTRLLDDGHTYHRGQFWLSPEAHKNMQDFYKKSAKETEMSSGG